MGRKGYPAEFRRRALKLLEAGRKVRDLAEDLGVSEPTIYAWRKQARIDAGEVAGLSSVGKSQLESARRRIRELEAELAVHRRATELLKEGASPKSGTRRSK